MSTNDRRGTTGMAFFICANIWFATGHEIAAIFFLLAAIAFMGLANR